MLPQTLLTDPTSTSKPLHAEGHIATERLLRALHFIHETLTEPYKTREPLITELQHAITHFRTTHPNMLRPRSFDDALHAIDERGSNRAFKEAERIIQRAEHDRRTRETPAASFGA